MNYTIPLFELNYDGAEEQAVLEVLRSRWISMGPKTSELEAAFAAHTGAAYAVAVGSCTAALHLALAAAGVGPGDEVIVPSLTFVATVNSVGYVGATPVFADIIGPENLCIDPEHVRTLITPRTRALIPMHYAGFPCDMDALGAIAREHNLVLIEDAAHAPVTRFQGRSVGTFGDASCFSFYSNKNLACGEGGMVTTNRKDIAEKVRLLRSHGMTSLSYDRSRGHATEYDVVARGYNFRMDDIRSALALAQMKKLAADTAARARIFQKYVEKLRTIDELTIPFSTDQNDSSYYIFPVALKAGGVERRNRVRQFLAERGIQTSVHYPAVHRFSIYSGARAVLPKTDWATDHEITLPLFARLSDEQLDTIAAALREALAQVKSSASTANIPSMIPLETPRLILRVCQPGDAAEVFAAERESIEELRRWFWWCHPEHTAQRSAAWAQSRVDAWRKGEEFSFLITDRNNGRLLGCIWFNEIDVAAASANIGYWLRAGCAGSGLVNEASRAVLRWAFEELGVERVQFVIAVENDRSQRSAELLGARRENMAPGRLKVNGRAQDAFIYSLRREDTTALLQR